jgi:hypothetical protein
MFDEYDDIEKAYEITYPDKTETQFTAQELYEFFLLSGTGIVGDFSDLKKRLDSGYAVTGDHMEWDWNLGTSIYKGKLIITRITPPKVPVKLSNDKKSNESKCKHEGKYVNQAGGIRFWVCPSCKKDLGDA